MRAITTSFILAIILLTVSKQAADVIELERAADPTANSLALTQSAEGEAEAEDSTELEDDDALNDHKLICTSFASHPATNPALDQNFRDVVQEIIPKPPRG